MEDRLKSRIARAFRLYKNKHQYRHSCGICRGWAKAGFNRTKRPDVPYALDRLERTTTT